jgi:hypothetical protein
VGSIIYLKQYLQAAAPDTAAKAKKTLEDSGISDKASTSRA